MNDLHNRDFVITRKEHKCEGCFDKIPAGSKVEYFKGRFDGDWYSYYLCDPCNDFVGSSDFEWGDGFTPGEIKYLREEAEQA